MPKIRSNLITLPHFLRNPADLPYNAHPAKHPQNIIRNIDLPPIEPLPGRALVIVMIIMPSLPKCHQRQPHTVLRFITGIVARLPKFVHQGVDGERSMKQQYRRKKEPDEQRGQSGGPVEPPGPVHFIPNEVNNNSQDQRRHKMILIQPEQLLMLHIPDQLKPRRLMLRSHDPSDMRIPETVDLRRMRVLRCIAVLVMDAVIGCPPKRSLLKRGLRPECEDKLEKPRRLERPVREIPVISARNKEHPHDIQYRTKYPVKSRYMRKKGEKWHQVDANKIDLMPPVSRLPFCCFHVSKISLSSPHCT